MRHLGKIFFGLIVILLVLVGYWFYRSHAVVNVTNNLDTSTGSNQQALLNETIATLSKFIVLPQDDSPVLGQVTDPKALASEPFFKDAQIGDQVLIYPNAKEAILYRPSIGKIILMESIPSPTSP
jgi:hypothetical protein